jgi:putative addiction module component (TIGR02574 family)
MTRATEEVLRRALRLNPVERAQLIEGLFRSFDVAPDPKTDAAWAKEAESRIEAYDSGKVRADSAKAVLARIAKR